MNYSVMLVLHEAPPRWSPLSPWLGLVVVSGSVVFSVLASPVVSFELAKSSPSCDLPIVRALMVRDL